MITRNYKLCACGCGRKGPIWSKGLLKWCYNRIYGRPIKKITEKKRKENSEDSIITQKLHELFLELWDETQDANGYCYCYETNTRMHKSIFRTNTCCYHHILEKGNEKYEKYIFEKWNIVIILPDVHGSIPNNTPRINLLTQELKEKY